MLFLCCHENERLLVTLATMIVINNNITVDDDSYNNTCICIHTCIYIYIYIIYIYIYGCESKLCMESSAVFRTFVTGLVPELCSVKLRLHIYTESNPFNIKQPLNMVFGCVFFLRDGIRDCMFFGRWMLEWFRWFPYKCIHWPKEPAELQGIFELLKTKSCGISDGLMKQHIYVSL